MSLGLGGGRFVRRCRCRMLSVPLGEQALGRRWDCLGLGHLARRRFGTKWYNDVPGARSTRDENNSSLVRYKIIKTLRRTQKFGETLKRNKHGNLHTIAFMENILLWERKTRNQGKK